MFVFGKQGSGCKRTPRGRAVAKRKEVLGAPREKRVEKRVGVGGPRGGRGKKERKWKGVQSWGGTLD